MRFRGRGVYSSGVVWRGAGNGKNFSKCRGASYEFYNREIDYGVFPDEPTKIYLNPTVSSNGVKGPGSATEIPKSVSERAIAVGGRDESPPHQSK